MRLAAGGIAIAAIAAVILGGSGPPRSTPLWPGSRFTQEDRDRAVLRGLDFLYGFARGPHFGRWGHDLLDAFYNIATTSRDPELRRRAWAMGRDRAVAWRGGNRTVPADAAPEDVVSLTMGDSAADRFGLHDEAFHAQLRRAAARFSAVDYLGFDPVREPPPADLPEPCSHCGHQNSRGATVCARCGTKLENYIRSDLFQDALIATYSGDLAGITLGAPYREVAKWLPAMHPYPARSVGEREFYSAVYTATHVVYTSNGYSRFLLSGACFPEELAYLQANLTQAVADQDPETMGEYLDSLRSFGLTFNHPLIRAGFEYLLGVQNADGSWGDPADPNPYGRYHPTWTAIDGLRDYRWWRVMGCRR